ncbi:MAG: tail fiber domain-containing protein, partial [Sphingobacteriales bacterium]
MINFRKRLETGNINSKCEFAITYGRSGIRVVGASGWIAGYFEGDLYTTGTYLSSDIRVKKNVSDFQNALNIINQLQPKYYEYKHDGHYAK